MSHSQRNSDPNISLERAQQQAQQRLRRFSQAVLHELDSETDLAIEVNGVPVGAISCMDSALAELAAGWALIHRFCESPNDFDRATVNDLRASVMVQGGIDIIQRRGLLLGEKRQQPSVPEPWPRAEEWTISEDVLLDILREAWNLFRDDRMAEGSIHAALASSLGVEVVAFDITAQNAVAKVLGWCLHAQRFPAHEILVMNGLITRPIVDAAARLGVKIVASPNVPTADALKTARVAGVSLVGYMRHQSVGLFGNADVVTLEESTGLDT